MSAKNKAAIGIIETAIDTAKAAKRHAENGVVHAAIVTIERAISDLQVARQELTGENKPAMQPTKISL